MRINTSKIEIALAERNMTWSQLACASGVSRQNITAIMRRGTCFPKTAGRLAAGLEVPVADIVKKEGET